MKNLFFLVFCFAFCAQLSAAAGPTTTPGMIEQDFAAFETSLSEVDAVDSEDLLACGLYTFGTGCGTTVTAQWCDEGLHGSLGSFIVRIARQACRNIQ